MLCIWNTRITCFQCIVIKYACIFMNKYVSFSKSWVLFSGENFISWTYFFFGQRLKWIQPWILTMEINNKMCMPAWAHIYVVVFFWCEFSGSGIDSNTFYMYYRTYNIYNKNASVSRSLCVCVHTVQTLRRTICMLLQIKTMPKYLLSCEWNEFGVVVFRPLLLPLKLGTY